MTHRYSPSENPRSPLELLERELRAPDRPRFSPAEHPPETQRERADSVFPLERDDGRSESLIAGVRAESMARA